jgi:hypothetical protein
MSTEKKTVSNRAEWRGKIWYEADSGQYWRQGTDGSWLSVNERSIERHLRCSYGVDPQRFGGVASEVERTLDDIQISYVLGGVEYIEKYQSDEFKKFANHVALMNGRNVLLLSSGVGK